MPYTLAKKYDAIDGKAIVTCSKELVNKRKLVVQVSRGFFGSSSSSYVYKSGCPLIQKTYKKRRNADNEEYVPFITNQGELDLMTLAQKKYIQEDANLIYLGERR